MTATLPEAAANSTSSGAVVSVDSATVHFGSRLAVDHVSFSLKPGDLLGLIGPNGAGKTTLLRSMAGLQRLSRGSVHVLDELVGPAKPALRHIGFTPDTPSFYEELTVTQFLGVIARGYNLSAAEGDDRIAFWLEKVWLTEKKSEKVKALSRGMRQRLGIARTLLPNPAIILLDEPASGLDPAGRVQFRQLLLDLRSQGKVVIVSSHILADMEEYCTHAGIMSQGKLIRLGTILEVAQGDVAAKQRYVLSLAAPVAQLAQMLSQIAEINLVHATDERASIEISPGKLDASKLLRRLLALGLDVCAFAPESVGLEDAYMRIGIQHAD